MGRVHAAHPTWLEGHIVTYVVLLHIPYYVGRMLEARQQIRHESGLYLPCVHLCVDAGWYRTTLTQDPLRCCEARSRDKIDLITSRFGMER